MTTLQEFAAMARALGVTQVVVDPDRLQHYAERTASTTHQCKPNASTSVLGSICGVNFVSNKGPK